MVDGCDADSAAGDDQSRGNPSGVRRRAGEPGTQVLLGDEGILDRAGTVQGSGPESGSTRATVLGCRATFFGFAEEQEDFAFQCDAGGNPILSRPFFNINPRDPFTLAFDPPAREDVELVCFPDVLAGNISVAASSELYSASLGVRGNLASQPFGYAMPTQYSRVDILAGYRYLRLQERLAITERVTSLDPFSTLSFEVLDEFKTRNEFHLADLALLWQVGWQRWSTELMLRTGLGNVRERVDIQGSTRVSEGGAAAESHVGGLLAQQSNIGRYSQDRFAVVPELGINLGYEIVPRWQIMAGYTLLWLSNVARPGDQIDRVVNPDQLPPPIEPLEGASDPHFNSARSISGPRTEPGPAGTLVIKHCGQHQKFRRAEKRRSLQRPSHVVGAQLSVAPQCRRQRPSSSASESAV